MSLPLEGFTVVAIEQAVAAPLATRNLADLGARVIKVERIDGGDFARGYDHVVHGTGAHFVWLNRGKESIAVDLKSAEGCSIVRRLIDSADVFVQNLAPGAADRLGLGADELRSQRPELVTVGISGFGVGGQFEQRKAYDMLIQAEAGLISITGTPDQPAKTGIPTADIAVRDVRRPGGAGRAAAPVAHRRGRDDRRVHARRDGRMDGPRPLHADVHRQLRHRGWA